LGMKVAFPSRSLYIEKASSEAQKEWDKLAKKIMEEREKNDFKDI